ncbi:MAG: hypothetical protein HY717_15195 [Planctomycetes bacterium]|nr:hypothetical protein [Planctomycetota bacterium]
MSILGLDIGTTGVKAVAFQEDGRLLASAYREYHLKSPLEGHLELDPREVLEAVRQVVGSVSQSTRQDPIRCAATSTLGEAAVPVDERNRPVANAIVGFDARGQEEMALFKEKIGNEEVFAITGHGINSYHTLFKVMWRRRRQPEVFRAAKRFLCFGDFVIASLGLPPRIDYSMAARTLAFDIHQKRWSRKILDAAGLEEVFAPPIAPGEAVGKVGSNDFGLPAGCVVAGGLHDQPAGILGAGIQPGESMLATGTVVCLGVRLAEEPARSGSMVANNLCYYPTFGDYPTVGDHPTVGDYRDAGPSSGSPGKDPWISIAWNFTGGSLLKWFRDQFAVAERAEAERRGVDPYEVICGQLPPQPTRLLVLPHFTTTGTPYLDPQALGAILGLRLTTTRQEIAKAILEGVAYEILLNAELLAEAGAPIQRYKAIGGAAKSPVWMQIYANILNRPVVQLEVTEGAAWGAALLGARGAGIFQSAGEVEAMVRQSIKEGKVFTPESKQAEPYRQRFKIYREVYPATRDLSHRMFVLQ